MVCKVCHGVKGEVNTTTQSKSYVPANLTKADIEKKLKGYKDGTWWTNESYYERSSS